MVLLPSWPQPVHFLLNPPPGFCRLVTAQSHSSGENVTPPPGAISVEPVQKGAGGGFLGGHADAARGQGWEHPGSPDHQGNRAEPLQAKDSTGNASPPHSSTWAYSCSTTSWKPTARGLTTHHSEHTGTHCQGTKSPACAYMLAQRTWMPEHIQKRCQHLREEKEARGHSQATAPTPAQCHLPVSPTHQQSVASGRRQALWIDRAASALTIPPGAWNPPALSHCALCRVAHSPAPGHGVCGALPGGSNLGTDTTHHTHTRKSWHFLLMVGD